MAAFGEGDEERLDWRLMQNGAVTLFYRTDLFDDAIEWLRAHAYVVHVIDASTINSFTDEMTVALRFQEQFGFSPWNGNLNALNDAFRYLSGGETTGVVFCFKEYDRLATADGHFAHAVLDILESNSRDHALLGQRLFALVQSDDPAIEFHGLGARSASWNNKEWLLGSRGL